MNNTFVHKKSGTVGFEVDYSTIMILYHTTDSKVKSFFSSYKKTPDWRYCREQSEKEENITIVRVVAPLWVVQVQ